MLQRVPPLRFGRFGPVLSQFAMSPNDGFRAAEGGRKNIIAVAVVVSHRGDVIRMLQVSNEQAYHYFFPRASPRSPMLIKALSNGIPRS